MTKRYILALSLLLATVASMAGNVPALQIEMRNGEVKQGVLANIDSLYFSDDAMYLYVVYQGISTQVVAADIDRITYGDIDDDLLPAIVWNGTSASAANPRAFEGVSIDIHNADVTIRSSHSDEIEYELSGESGDGLLKIYSEKKFQLTLKGLSLTNQRGAAINSQTGKKFTFKNQKGYVNTLADGAVYSLTPDDEDEKACLFSEGQIVFSGAGTLNISSQKKHAIASDDYLYLDNGTIHITGAGDGKAGLHANDSIILAGAAVDITVAGDSVYEDGDVDWATGVKSKGDVLIASGSLVINNAGLGGKGIRAKRNIDITGGDIRINLSGSGGLYSSVHLVGMGFAATDVDAFTTCGLKADSAVNIIGGTVDIQAMGSIGTCGIKSDGTLTVGSIASAPALTVATYGQYVSSGNSTTGSGGKGGGGGHGPGGMGGNDNYLGDPKAIKILGEVVVNNGDITLSTVAAGGEGLESKTQITVNGGSIAASCYDDAINCAGQIVFNGGYVYVRSTGNDGIDSNGTGFLFNGGVVLSSGTSGAEEGFDCDNYPFSIQGGTLVGIGGATSTPTSAAQPYASVSGVSITAGKYLGVKTADGTLLFAMKCPNTLSNATVVLSHPQFAAATTYTLVYNATSVNVPDLTLFDGDYCEGGTTTDGSNKTFTPKTK